MIYAVIAAGGIGSRMGNVEKPKQYLKIKDKPIIAHTVEKFFVNDAFRKIIILTPAQWVNYTKELLAKYLPQNDKVVVVKGGDTRNETIMNAVRYIEENDGLDDDTVIVTHDAVRPFIDDRIIDDNILAARGYGACNTCVPAVDTVLLSKGGRYIDFVPPRSSVFHAQTPQSFDAKRLYELIKATPPEDFRQMTDGFSVFIYHGEKVFIVKGSENNIKITFPEDIVRAEAILKGGQDS